MIGTLPTETITRAFNANSVASVYISSGYGDLATKSEVGAGKTSVFENEALSLQNGIYGMSDPANLQGMVERFEVELTQGGTSKGTYRIRLINPTDELEVFLFGIYNAVFPSLNSSFDIYAEAALENKAKTTVKAINESNPLKDLLQRGMQLPFLYLRWGYGTKLEEGLSRIHKCVLFGCEYSINSNQDKVVELHLIDWFSSLAENQTFNIAPELTQESCLDDQKQLKDISTILSELVQKYTQVFPGIIPLYDVESTNMEQLNVITNNLAVTQWKEYLEYEKEGSVGEPGKWSPSSTADGSGISSTETLTIDINLAAGKDFSDGNDELSQGHKIWLGAYSQVFKFLGINQSHSSDQGEIDPVTVDTADFTSPDSRSSLGKAFNHYKKTMGMLTTEIGELDFMVPVWEVPSAKPTWQLKNPLMVVAEPVIPLQPFSTPRAVNYNPNTAMQAEMTTSLDSPFVKGYLCGTGLQAQTKLGDIGATFIFGSGDTQSGDSRLLEMRVIDAYTLSFDEFESIIVDLRKLNDFVLEGKSFGMGSPEFELMPTALLTATDINNSQPSWSPFSAPIPFSNYLLYSPVNASETISPATSSPYVGAGLPLLSAGSFQTKGRSLKPGKTVTPYIPEYQYIYTDEVTIGTDSNIMDLETQHDYYKTMSGRSRINNANPFMRLVPSPQAIATLEAKFLALQKAVLAAASETQYVVTRTGNGSIMQGTRQVVAEYVTATRDLEARYNHSVDVFLGTGNSTTPHITKVLIKLVTGINKLLVAEKDPFVVQQVDLNSLTPEEFTALFKPTGLMSSLKLDDEAKDQLQVDKPMLLLIGRSSWLSDSFSNRLLSKIHSFPEITRTEEHLQDYIFLSYGQANSIVTDLKFMGDVRTLYNIPKAFYATRQFNSLQGFFKTADQSETDKMLRDMILFVHENKYESRLSTIKDILTESMDDEINKLLLEERDALLKERADIKSIKAIDYKSQKEYLDAFPTLITKFTNEQLEAGGFPDPLAARKVASVLGSKEYTKLLFPVTSYTPGKGIFLKTTKTPLPTRRQLDVATFNKKLSALEKASLDAKMNYVQNSQNESWQVEISTLGIPEIDIMGAEFFARRVVLTVSNPRGGKTAAGAEGYHWLSGVYSIVGIKHELQPSSGFITNLSLVKVPAATLPAYA